MKREPPGASVTGELLRLDAGKFQELIYHYPDGIVVVADSGKIRFANPAARTLFARDDLVGQPLGLPLRGTGRTVLEIPRGEKAAAKVEIEVAVVRWDDQPARLVSLRDVSERERLEQQLREARKMEAIGRLTAGIAHDFNNMLTGIIGAAFFLSSAAQAHGDDTSDIELILRLARRAADIVGQLLAFSREQQVDQKTEPVDEVVARAVDLIEPLMGDTIEISRDLQAGDACAAVDERQIQQVISNIAINARDAMQKQGKLTISTRTARVDRALLRRHPELNPGPHVIISVADTGPGIDEQIIDSIFDPFFTTKGRAEHRGLGLSVAHGIVREHGGTIGLDSELGKGTVFEVYLPRAYGEVCALPNNKS